MSGQGSISEKRTTSDLLGGAWAVDDSVIRLRGWGTENFHGLVPPNPLTVGSSPHCTIHYPDRMMSREHLRITYAEGKWFATDLGSKNGTKLDGIKLTSFVLTPGSEITIGTTTLVAESARTIELRLFLRRILGWASERLPDVDRARRAVLLASTGRITLHLCSEVDLMAVAHSLHRYVLGPDRPFVSCDPRRVDAETSVRSVANKTSAVAAYDAASGGTLCLRGERLPEDFQAVEQRMNDPDSRIQLVIVGRDHRSRNDPTRSLNPSVYVPPLEQRAREIPMIVDHYGRDAELELKLPGRFTAEDREWVLEHAAASLGACSP